MFARPHSSASNVSPSVSALALHRALAAAREPAVTSGAVPAEDSEMLTRIEALIAAGALTDAVLAFLTLKLPQWKLRRLVWDGAEWLCTLSRQPNLPIEFDSTAEGHDEQIVSALLAAIAEAQRLTNERGEENDDNENDDMAEPATPTSGIAVSCDNFS